MPELWPDRIDASTLGPIRIQTSGTLEQLLCAAEIAKAALTKLANVERTDVEWLADYERAENAWITAESELCEALNRKGFDVKRIVEVLS
jgi:hypothetical protein